MVGNRDLFEAEDGPKKIASIAKGLFLIFIGALAVYAVILPDNLVNFKHFMKGSLGFEGMQYFFLALFVINALVLLDATQWKSRVVRWLSHRTQEAWKAVAAAIILLPPIVFGLVVLNTLFGKDLLLLFSVPFDATNDVYFADGVTLEVLLRQFLPLVFSLSPLVIAAFIYASIKNVHRTGRFHWIVLVGNFFILVYVAAVTFQEVSLTIRYGILLYPVVMTIAAMGIYQFFSGFKNKKMFLAAACVFVTLLGISRLWVSKPFYFNYTNFLLPKNFIITDAWGYGGYEAAKYLNEIPGIEKTRIWADYNGVCVFFNGNCAANKLTMQNIRKNAKKKGELPKFEYFVSMRRGYNQSVGLWEDLSEEYGSKQVFNLDIGNRPANFVRVFANSSVDTK